MFTELLGGESKPVRRLQQDRALMSLKENLLQNDRSLKDSYFVQTQLSAYNGSQVYHRVLTFLPQEKKSLSYSLAGAQWGIYTNKYYRLRLSQWVYIEQRIEYQITHWF